MAAPETNRTRMGVRADPDLSMELQERLKQDLGARSAAAREALRAAEAPEDAEALMKVQATQAVAAVVKTLQDFYGELSRDKLSQHVLDIVHSDAIVGHTPGAFRTALRKVVPGDRAEWLAGDVEAHLKRASQSTIGMRARAIVKSVRAAVHDKRLQVSSAGAVSGAAALGGSGAAAGMAVGATVGLSMALFTFGLSIPAGAIIGGGLGTVAGSTVGAIGGGATGYVGYSHRSAIKAKASDLADCATVKASCVKNAVLEGIALIQKQASETRAGVRSGAIRMMVSTRSKVNELKQSAKAWAIDTKSATTTKASNGAAAMKTKASEISDTTSKLAKDPVVQKDVASAAGGAVVLGTAGGAVGTVAGGLGGAMVGLPAALFTFGLSVPVCAAVGSGMGLCAGAVTGGTVGAVTGGVGCHYRSDIKDTVSTKFVQACDTVHYMRAQAKGSAMAMRMAMRERLVGGTGGTA